MGKIELNQQIMGSMGSWGGNFDSKVGNSHNTSSDHVDPKIDSKEVTINTPSKMDAPHPKPSAQNGKVDKAFLAKGNPQMDTTGHGKLTRSCKD